MTKGELRKARKAARASGKKLTGDLALRGDVDHSQPGLNAFSETKGGYRARERWARHYDRLNGAPEGDWDR